MPTDFGGVNKPFGGVNKPSGGVNKPFGGVNNVGKRRSVRVRDNRRRNHRRPAESLNL